MRKQLAGLSAVIVGCGLLGAPVADAGECDHDRWQPTFVRHDSIRPTVYYVEPGGGFTRMTSPTHAQETCRARGVREAIRGDNCRHRRWGDFGCGCNVQPPRNRTCAAFLTFLSRSRGTDRTESAPAGGGGPVFINPRENGLFIDHCLFWGRQCDQPAADYFCRRRGYARAAAHRWQYRRPTLLMGSKRTCRTRCGAFTYIKCQGAGRGTDDGPDSPGANAGRYAVFLLTNVAGGSVWVGTEAVLQRKRRCNFQGGGLCGNSGPVRYRRLSRGFGSFHEAAAEYCRHRSSAPRRVPLTAGSKATVYGKSYWVTNAPNHKCPRAVQPPGDPRDSKYGVFVMTNVAGGSIFVGRRGSLAKMKTCNFQGGGLCSRSPAVTFRRLSPLYDNQREAVADYCRHRTSKPRRIPLTAGSKATVYGRSYWVSNAPHCP